MRKTAIDVLSDWAVSTEGTEAKYEIEYSDKHTIFILLNTCMAVTSSEDSAAIQPL
jgi:hypothetical protein